MHEIVGVERVVLALDRIAVEADATGFERADRLLQRLGNVRPIAMTSPTDCICVPSTGDAPGSFSNAHRGNFVTT